MIRSILSPLLVVASLVMLQPQVVIAQAEAGKPGPWKLQKDKKGIQVFTRKNPKSIVDEFKTVMILDAELKFVKVLVENVDKHTLWQENCTRSEILKQQDAKTKYIYYTTDVPWPIKDRDIVIYQRKYVGEDGSIRYTMEPKPDFIPLNDDFVRINNSFGSWRLIPMGNQVKVIHQFYGDPEGNIPAWIVNLFIIEGPYNTFINLRELVTQLKAKSKS